MVVSSALSIPFFGMMLLTIMVWFYMYACRLTFVIRNQIPAQALSTPEKLNQLVPESINAPSNNLKNLFELPILFYGACLYEFIQGETSILILVCAYVFWLFRTLHSIIHCTLNHVLLRFTVYIIASTALFILLFIEIMKADLSFF